MFVRPRHLIAAGAMIAGSFSGWAVLAQADETSAATSKTSNLHQTSGGRCTGDGIWRLQLAPDPERAGIVGRFRIQGALPGEEWVVEYTIDRPTRDGETVSRHATMLVHADRDGVVRIAFRDVSDRRHTVHIDALSRQARMACDGWSSVRFQR